MGGVLGIMLGLAYVASPGPVNIEALRRGLAGGFRVALAPQLGAIVGDLAWALLAVAGAGRLLTHAAAQTILGIAGTALLVYLGCSALRSWGTLTAWRVALARPLLRRGRLLRLHGGWSGPARRSRRPMRSARPSGYRSAAR